MSVFKYPCIVLITLAYMTNSIHSQQQAEQPSALDLVEKHENTMKPYTSQIIKSDTIHEDVINGQKIWGRTIAEFRRQDEKFDMIKTRWVRQENREALENPDLSENSRQMYDGELFFDGWGFGENPSDVVSSRIMVSREWENIERAMGVGYVGAPLDGQFPGDDRYISTILREAETLDVVETTSVDGKVSSYEIKATNENGTYSVWIDPNHDYHIAKAEVQLNDKFTGVKKPPPLPADLEKIAERYRLPKTIGMVFNLDNVKFKKIDGKWVPVEADFYTRFEKIGGEYTETNRHHKRTYVNLNPDFEKVGAFVPNIPNGTIIEIPEWPGIAFEWKDGEIGQRVDDSIVATIVDTINQEKDEMAVKSEKQHQPKSNQSTPENQTVAATSSFVRSYSIVLFIFVLMVVIGVAIVWFVIRAQKRRRNAA